MRITFFRFSSVNGTKTHRNTQAFGQIGGLFAPAGVSWIWRIPWGRSALIFQLETALLCINDGGMIVSPEPKLAFKRTRNGSD
ncbi:hypothetical protein DS909_13215 [Phaeobacter gallaeciensis]|uniref:Uncharacterized protein n=1 Tax=Phaeobacter gallaeciensis TaxID=60890 RepID=A0A366WVI8_9RHOB|nr:hypothetical protein DS909_13215 [Phaeobacter gallaeciensis]